MSVKNRHRKICGYLGCFIILGTLLETEIPTIRNHATIENIRTERVQVRNKRHTEQRTKETTKERKTEIKNEGKQEIKKASKQPRKKSRKV